MLPQLKRLTLKSGEKLHIADGATAIVGPNNAGKTRLLTEMLQLLQGQQESPSDPRVIVHDFELEWPGDEGQYEDWVNRRYNWQPAGARFNGNHMPEEWLPLTDGQMISRPVFSQARASNSIGTLFPVYVRNFDVDSRFGFGFESGMYNRREQHPSNAIQAMWADPELERRISEQILRAFGRGLTVDRAGGSHIATHFGILDNADPQNLPDYDEKLARLPRLSNQGHGVRSLAGILLALATSEQKLIIIDEPEAFLHPPQARLLGEMLASEHGRDRQVIVATHSEEILQGLSEGAGSGPGYEVSITRINRGSNGPHRSQISTDLVNKIKSDSLLRYSTVLNGLFFKGTIVCEGDGDCTYYRAVLNYIREPGEEPSDIHFMHCNGKAKIFRAVELPREAEVPTRSIVDFDWLREPLDFDRLVEVHGGSVERMRSKRDLVADSIGSSKPFVTRRDTLIQMIDLLAVRGDEPLSERDKDEVRQHVKKSTAWDSVKQKGVKGLPESVREAFTGLDSDLRSIGIFVVPVGELELFHPDAPRSRKAAWLAHVLENELYQSDPRSHAFVREIVASLNRESEGRLQGLQ